MHRKNNLRLIAAGLMIILCLRMMSVLETTVLFKGRLICMVVIVFAMAKTLSALNFMSAFLISALIFYILTQLSHPIPQNPCVSRQEQLSGRRL